MTVDGLGARGAALWADVTAGYELGPDELEILVELCRTLDVIEGLHAESVDRPVVDGRWGPVVNPAVRELRAQRAELRHLAAALGLPDPTGRPQVESGNTKRARAAADARWKKE